MHGCSPSCFLIDQSLLIDAGSVASHLSLKDQLGIRDILLTHVHLDHIRDLPFLAENIFDQFQSSVRVHLSQDSHQKLKQHIFNGEIWPDFSMLPNQVTPILKFVPFQENTPFEFLSHQLTAVPVNHPGGCHAFIIQSENTALVFAADSGPTEALWHQVNGLDQNQDIYIFMECSFPNRLQNLARMSGHLCPFFLTEELKKIKVKHACILVHSLKAPYLDEIKGELAKMSDPRLDLVLTPRSISL